jgi:hypothetical protein
MKNKPRLHTCRYEGKCFVIMIFALLISTRVGQTFQNSIVKDNYRYILFSWKTPRNSKTSKLMRQETPNVRKTRNYATPPLRISWPYTRMYVVVEYNNQNRCFIANRSVGSRTPQSKNLSWSRQGYWTKGEFFFKQWELPILYQT